MSHVHRFDKVYRSGQLIAYVTGARLVLDKYGAWQPVRMNVRNVGFWLAT